MELVLKIKKVKRGTTSKGDPYLMIGFGDRINGFVSRDDMENFGDVQRGDFCEVEMYSFPDEGGIKLFPRRLVMPEP